MHVSGAESTVDKQRTELGNAEPNRIQYVSCGRDFLVLLVFSSGCELPKRDVSPPGPAHGWPSLPVHSRLAIVLVLAGPWAALLASSASCLSGSRSIGCSLAVGPGWRGSWPHETVEMGMEPASGTGLTFHKAVRILAAASWVFSFSGQLLDKMNSAWSVKREQDCI